MRIIDGCLYVEFDELVESGVSKGVMNSAVKRGSKNWEFIKDPDDRRRRLTAYERLSDRHKSRIQAKFGDPYTWLKNQELSLQVVAESSAKRGLTTALKVRNEWYEMFLESMPHQEAMQRALGCAWLDLLTGVKGPKEAGKLGFDSKESLIDAALECIKKAGMKCLRVTNKRVLREWMKRWKTDGPACMKNPWKGNSSACKVDDGSLRFLMTLAADPHKASVPVITMLYNREATERGWKQVTSVTVYNWLKKPQLQRIWNMGRHGEEAWYNEYDMTILREAPSAPDVLWVGDGTPLDLYYKRQVRKWDEKNQRWVERTNYYNRLDVFLIIDAHSWRILGWSLVENENAQSVVQALKMAAGEKMRLPRQFQHDGGSGIEAQKWLIEQLDIHNTKTRPYSPKSKVIETLIGKIQDGVLRYFDNWAGMNITAKKKDSRFNPDFLKEGRDEVPTYEGLVAQWKEVVTIWNNKATKDREAPELKYFAKASAGTQVEPLSFITMFWEKRRDTYLYRQDGITIQIDGTKHHFQVLSAEFYKKHIRDRFEVVYDRDCLDFVYLYQNGKPVLDSCGEPIVAEAAELVPMALHDMQEGDRTRLNMLLGIKDKVKADTQAEVRELRKYAAEEGIKLGHRFVFKAELNRAETAVKTAQIPGAIDWEKELDNMYFDE